MLTLFFNLIDQGGSSQKVKLKKELGLLEGVAIIIGIIVGSGTSLKTFLVFQNMGFSS